TTGLRIGQINLEGLDASRDIRVIGLQDNGVAATTDLGANWKSFSCCDGGGIQITEDTSAVDPTFWFCNGTPWSHNFRQKYSGEQQSTVYGSNEQYELFYDRFRNRVFTASGDSSATYVVS